jgi:hypothetical protein
MGINKDNIGILYIFTSGSINSPNIKHWIDLFYNCPKTHITLLIKDCDESVKQEFYSKYNHYFEVIFFKNYSEISQISWFERFLYILKISKIIKKVQADLIHIHGCYYPYMIKPLLFLRKKKQKIIFNVWGNDFNAKYYNSLKQKIIMRYLIKWCDLIWANWYTMEENLKNEFPNYRKKIKTVLWGVESTLFNNTPVKIKDDVRNHFNIKTETYLLLYAKGLLMGNNQIDLVKSLQYIDNSLDYHLILQSLNSNEKSVSIIKNLIQKYNLQNKITISSHVFSDQEIKALFEISDLSFALSTQDQLTRTIFESILSKTNLIVNDIKPYRVLDKKFNLGLDFVEVSNLHELAKKISYYINIKPKPNWRSQKIYIRKNYTFDHNLDRYMGIYEDLIFNRPIT